jgi:phosphate/sulfate permease
MAQDDQIKKSIRRNATKKKITDGNSDLGMHDQGSFKMLCRLLNAPRVSKLVAMIMAIAGITVYVGMSSQEGATFSSTILYSLVIVIVIGAAYALYLYSWYPGYMKLITEKPYSLKGWKDFIASRSESFWKDKQFVKITVLVNMAPLANTSHHQAVVNFLKKWEEDGDSIYSGTKWEGGRPDSFKSSGKSISGHISLSNGMRLLLSKLLNELPELITRLGKENLTISISWTSEVNFNENTSQDSIEEAIENERYRKYRDSE